MDFVAIDFETATASRSSACSVAVSEVSNNHLYDAYYSLIKPPDMKFNYYNIQIHGIHPEDVVDKPDFAHIWPELCSKLDGKIVVAHNASFDMSVLKACLNTYSLPAPRFEYFCTVQIAKKVWPNLENHKLNTLGDYFQIDFQHHNAMEDARICAAVGLYAGQVMQIDDFITLGRRLDLAPKKFSLK